MAKASGVSKYIKSAAIEHQPTLQMLRRMIRKHVPNAQESIGSAGFPVYTMGGRWVAGFAFRKKGPMLYVMDTALVDRYAVKLGKLRSANSCIDWRATKELPIDELTALANQILGELSRK